MSRDGNSASASHVMRAQLVHVTWWGRSRRVSHNEDIVGAYRDGNAGGAYRVMGAPQAHVA